MNNIYFYLILAAFLYFIFTRVLENFLVEQENFDPSLVPVSSIVTLAKVAQKLIGSGTLINPGNLQVGNSAPSAAGNLTVSGNATITGNTTFGGLYTYLSNGATHPYSIVKNPTNIGFVGTNAAGTDYNWANTISMDNNANMRIGGPLLTTPSTSSGNLSVTGNTNIGGPVTATNYLTYGASAQFVINSRNSPSGPTTDPNALIWYNQDGTKTQLWNSSGGNVMTIDKDKKLTVTNNIKSPIFSADQFNDSSNNPRIQFWTDKNSYYNTGAGNKHKINNNNVTITGDLTVNGTVSWSTLANWDKNTYSTSFVIGPIRIQCGYDSSGSSEIGVTFSPAFSAATGLQVFASLTNGVSTSNAGGGGQHSPVARNISNTGCIIHCDGSCAINWIAIGPA